RRHLERGPGAGEGAVQRLEILLGRDPPHDGVLAPVDEVALRRDRVPPLPVRHLRGLTEGHVDRDLVVRGPVDEEEQLAVRLGDPGVDLDEPELVRLAVPHELHVEGTVVVSDVAEESFGDVDHPFLDLGRDGPGGVARRSMLVPSSSRCMSTTPWTWNSLRARTPSAAAWIPVMISSARQVLPPLPRSSGG